MNAPAPLLASTVVGASGPAALEMTVLHGIYGRGRNWGAIARHLAARRPDWRSRPVDLRLHGDSVGFAPPHTVDAAARDVLDLEHALLLSPRAVLGHSFGGKVALAYAARTDLRPLQVWVIDSTPEARPPDGAAWNMLGILASLPPDFASRQEAIDGLVPRGVPPAVAAWMVTLTMTHRIDAPRMATMRIKTPRCVVVRQGACR